MDVDLLTKLLQSLNSTEPQLMVLEVAHDPDCPKLFGKPCTCNPKYKAKKVEE